jgi:Cdc6-like AAA superfamily ATPase
MEKETYPDIYIKNVAVQINKLYQLENSPFGFSEPDPKRNQHFIGRESQKARMKEFLRSGREKGVFLVTGYRGMGKTSFVHRVLREYEQELKERAADAKLKKKKRDRSEFLEVVDVMVVQNNLTEESILRDIVNRLFDREKAIQGGEEAKYEQKKRTRFRK